MPRGDGEQPATRRNSTHLDAPRRNSTHPSAILDGAMERGEMAGAKKGGTGGGSSSTNPLHTSENAAEELVSPPPGGGGGGAVLATGTVLVLANSGALILLLVIAAVVYRHYCCQRMPEEPDSSSRNGEAQLRSVQVSGGANAKSSLFPDRKVKSSNETARTLYNVMTSVNTMLDKRQDCRLSTVLDFEEVTKQTWQTELHDSLEPSNTSPDEASSLGLIPKSDVHASVFKHGLSCGRYEFVATLGEGSTAVCFTVMKVDTSELCVLKAPKRNSTSHMVAEAYFTAWLSHPNIVKHLETFIHDGNLIVAMELCAMGSLASSINAMRNRRAFFPEETVVAVLLDLASGLAWMHRNFLAHRDIKPENAFISAEGSVKIGDLGSSRLMIDTSTSLVGTPLYMAPEVLHQHPYSFETDIWSLGSVMYEMCTLQLPFVGNTLDTLKETVSDATPYIPGDRYRPELRQLITRMFAKDPKARPTAEEIISAPWLMAYDRSKLSASVQRYTTTI